MDSLVSLFAMEASGVIDAETMVKGVVPIALCFFSVIFLRGSLAGQAWASSEHHISQLYRIIACMTVSAPHWTTAMLLRFKSFANRAAVCSTARAFGHRSRAQNITVGPSLWTALDSDSAILPLWL